MELNEEKILSKDYTIDIGKAFNVGNEILQKNLGGFIGFFVLQIIIEWCISLIFGYSLTNIYRDYGQNYSTTSFLGSIVSFVINALLTPGFFHVAHKIRNREETSFGDFFYAFSNEPGQFILMRLVAFILIGIGLVLLVIPGIYLMVAYGFCLSIQTVYKGNFWTNLELSRKVITQVWGKMFLLLICIFLINVLGAIPCGLGILYTMPLSMCVVYAAFHDIFQPNSNVMDDKISSFGQDQKDINTERDENNYLK